MSAVRFNCGGCHLELEAPVELIGIDIRCDSCDYKQAVPNFNDGGDQSQNHVQKPNRKTKLKYKSSTAIETLKRNGRRSSSSSNKIKVTATLATLSTLVFACFYLFLQNPEKHTQVSVAKSQVPENSSSQQYKMPDKHSSSEMDDKALATSVSKIDELIAKQLKVKGIKPNPQISDDVFLRRIYLSLAGRVPSVDEVKNFKRNNDSGKRSELISSLLKSSGYNSHMFNFWADILRVIEDYVNREYTHAYQLWLKESIAKNKPYDQMVRELVSARGLLWDNGAIGYYARDRGMPLDNTANTVRIFLGVRLECAQCHDHPFESWTQKDFYQLAAHTFPVKDGYPRINFNKIKPYIKDFVKERAKKATGYEDFPIRTVANFEKLKQNNPKSFRRLLSNYADGNEAKFWKKAASAEKIYFEMSKLNENVKEGGRILYKDVGRVGYQNLQNRQLKLPHDYQYDDGKPGEIVRQRTIFEKQSFSGDLQAKYAEWMTSKDNPQFTKVIVNRLWKKAFGIGFVEPVDHFQEHTVSSNPELFEYLCQLMKKLNYNVRSFQEVIYNSSFWQSEAETEELALGVPYYHQGPVLKRLSAEQVWDSLVHLIRNDADEYQPRMNWQKTNIEKRRKIYEKLESNNFDSYFKLITEAGKISLEYSKKVSQKIKTMQKAKESKNQQEIVKVKRELKQLGKDYDNSIKTIAGISKDQLSMQSEVIMKSLYRRKTNAAQEENDLSSFARASELLQPANPGSLLRVFGQSDRELIENSSLEPSIPQALYMMNGDMVKRLLSLSSNFGMRLNNLKESSDQIDFIYLNLLSRYPGPDEKNKVLKLYRKYPENGNYQLLWTLLNSQQFLHME